MNAHTIKCRPNCRPLSIHDEPHREVEPRKIGDRPKREA